jgi:hypothetical protein
MYVSIHIKEQLDQIWQQHLEGSAPLGHQRIDAGDGAQTGSASQCWSAEP